MEVVDRGKFVEIPNRSGGEIRENEGSCDEDGSREVKMVIKEENAGVSSSTKGYIMESKVKCEDSGSSSICIDIREEGVAASQHRIDESRVEAYETASGCLASSVHECVCENQISKCPEENLSVKGGSGEPEGKSTDSGPSDELVKNSKENVAELVNSSYAIDIGCHEGLVGDLEREKVCRICHLNSESEQSLDSDKEGTAGNDIAGTNTELIQLGCGCKGELAVAHSHCAEAWFKLKGNRYCEICGETAKNVSGVGDSRFIDEWHDRGYATASLNSSERGGCWRGHPFCNFLMACLVIAFVLPWFFRVNMF